MPLVYSPQALGSPRGVSVVDDNGISCMDDVGNSLKVTLAGGGGGGIQYADGNQTDTPTGTQVVWTDSSTAPDTQRAVRDTAPMPVGLYNPTSGAKIGIDTVNPLKVQQAGLTLATDQVSAGPLVPFTITITGSGAAQQIIAAPAVNTHLVLFKIIVSNHAAVAVQPGVRNGATGANNLLVDLSATVGDAKNIGPAEGYLPLTGGATPTGLYSSNFAAGAGTVVTYSGYYRTVVDNAADTAVAALW